MVHYQKISERPDRGELQELVDMLQEPVEDLVRKDATFKRLGLRAADYVDSPQAVVDILDRHIELLQRPILVRGNVAIIGRPKQRVLDFVLS